VNKEYYLPGHLHRYIGTMVYTTPTNTLIVTFDMQSACNYGVRLSLHCLIFLVKSPVYFPADPACSLLIEIAVMLV
jgi:hypothetical protein